VWVPRHSGLYYVPLLERLDWAQCRLKGFETAAQRFFAQQAVTIRSESNAEATEYVVRVEKGIDMFPFEIALRIGEVAHHARSVLDWLGCAIGDNPGDSTTFPLWTEPRTNVHGKPIKPELSGGQSARARSFIEQVQPYERWRSNPTDSPLYLIDQLDKIDKHKQLIPAACSNAGHFGPLGVSFNGIAEVEYFRSELKPGNKLMRTTFTEPNPGLEFDYEPFPYVSVNGIAANFDELNIAGELSDGINVVRRMVIAASDAGLFLR
jgi:hypothetical protein